MRRFQTHKEYGSPYEIGSDHISARLGTSLFREGRLASSRFAEEPVFKSGVNNRKIGSHVAKGKWSGYPIFTLTLEERATCPRTCVHWLDCFGNKMNWPTRFMADADLIPAIEHELIEFSEKYNNFVIRLHVLGDFFSVHYVNQWLAWIQRFPGLHVYGYTAWLPDTPIGALIAQTAEENWERFAIRTSNHEGLRSTLTQYTDGVAREDGIVCPAQTGKTECCGTCALCWQTQERIIFLAH